MVCGGVWRRVGVCVCVQWSLPSVSIKDPTLASESQEKRPDQQEIFDQNIHAWSGTLSQLHRGQAEVVEMCGTNSCY